MSLQPLKMKEIIGIKKFYSIPSISWIASSGTSLPISLVLTNIRPLSSCGSGKTTTAICNKDSSEERKQALRGKFENPYFAKAI